MFGPFLAEFGWIHYEHILRLVRWFLKSSLMCFSELSPDGLRNRTDIHKLVAFYMVEFGASLSESISEDSPDVSFFIIKSSPSNNN